MDSPITAAARALAAGDPLGALNRVAFARRRACALILPEFQRFSVIFWVVTGLPGMSDRLRGISQNESLMLAPTDGLETLARATELFRYIDSNFVSWNCDAPAPPTETTPVQVYELIKDSTFAEMFASFELAFDRLTLTQAQIKQFAQRYPEWLKQGGNGTFFLFKVDRRFFVAAVYLFSDCRLGVRVRHLALERTLRAQKRHRLVLKVP
jgi:hypothetical protein